MILLAIHSHFGPFIMYLNINGLSSCIMSSGFPPGQRTKHLQVLLNPTFFAHTSLAFAEI